MRDKEMNCPHCEFNFPYLLESLRQVKGIPDFAPVVCNHCGEVSALIGGECIRKLNAEELDAVKLSPAWENLIAPVKALISNRKKAEMALRN